MRRVLIFIAGLLVGSVAALYFLGPSRSGNLSGIPLRAPDANSSNTGTVSVTVDEKFFDSLLATIFQQLGSPQLKLAQLQPQSPFQPAAFQDACSNIVVLNPEGGNIKTGVRFTGGKITAPLAFTGSYSVLAQCIQFKGTARATVGLAFNQEKQTVFGALNIEEMILENVPPLVSALVTAFVRQTIDARVNPFEVLRVSQLALSLPIQVTGGSVKANVKDVRSDVQEGSLRMFLTYDFSAEKNTG
jgi:ABC-type uncharacterized transport system YnjBCD ATPase subunit